MKTLGLTIGRDSKAPCEMYVVDDADVGYREEFKGSLTISNKGKFGLLILAIHTALFRSSSFSQGGDTPSVELKPSEFGDALFDTAIRKKLKPNHWAFRIFDCAPYNIFLIPQIIDEEKYVRISNKLGIELIWDDTGKHLNRNEMAALLRQLKNQPTRNPTFIRYELDVVEPHRSFTISPERMKGSITNASEISLRISHNLDCDLLVLWVTSNGNIRPLHPEIDKYLKVAASTETPKGSTKSITIPSDEFLTIEGPIGVDTCLIITREARFATDTVSQIVKRLEHALKICRFARAFRNPKSNYLRLSDPINEAPEGIVNLGPPRHVGAWEATIGKSLRGAGEVVHFLHIPHANMD